MRMKSSILAAVALGMTPALAAAATVSVDVRDMAGKPVANAVVIVDAPHTASAAATLRGPFVMGQQNISFTPHVLVVPVGATVTFPNRDRVRHHVYSFSAPKKFDMKLYGREETRSVVFDKPGVVALGCNIHDSMSGFVYVVDTPFAVVTNAQGHATISGVPAGRATIRLWSPAIRARGNTQAQPVTIPAAGFAGSYTIGAQ
jgi:plastocyanin